MVATLGCILPSCIIVTLLAKLYLKYQKLDVLQSVLNSLRPAVVALIRFCRDLHPGHCFLGQRGSDPAGRYGLAPGGYFYSLCSALQKLKWNPILVMVLAGVMKLAAAAAQKWIF